MVLGGWILFRFERCCETWILDIHFNEEFDIMRFSHLAALAGPAQAALRFGCSTSSIQRLDPLVEPGKLPSAHVHQIVGGNAFNATMDVDPATVATCTTCTFSEDFR